MRKRLLVMFTLALVVGLDLSVLLASLYDSLISMAYPLRLFSGAILLLFLQGYLLLKVLNIKLHNLSETLFLSIGISISITLLWGLFIEFVLPLLGVTSPFSIRYVMLVLNITIVILLLFFCILDGHTNPAHRVISIKIKLTFNYLDLFFVLLPILSLLSAYYFNISHNNIGLLVVYIVISITPLIFLVTDAFNYTLALWLISLSLILSTTFGISWNYIWGYDINGEYHWAKSVLMNGFWNINEYNQYNVVASVNILAPIYSLVLNKSLIWIFKLVYPFLLSFVPVVLYVSYLKLLRDKRMAVFSVLFFMFIPAFFVNMLALARQMIAELYLSLIIYSIVTRLDKKLFLLFIVSLAISHYGTAYLLMFALLVLAVVFSFIKLKFYKKYIDSKSVALFWIITLLWYMYTGGGFQFRNLTNIVYQTFSYIQYLFNPQYSQGLSLLVGKLTPIRQIAKWINLLALIFILLGMLRVLYQLFYADKKHNLEFYGLSIVFLMYDLAGIAVPFFSNRLNTARLYQITLFFLAPYFVIGILCFISLFRTIILRKRKQYKAIKSRVNSLKLSAVFLIIYFLFNSGIMMVVANDPKPPMWLTKSVGPYWTSPEIVGAGWLALHKQIELRVYSDQYSSLLFLNLLGQPIGKVYFKCRHGVIINLPVAKAYVYFNSFEINYKKIVCVLPSTSISLTIYLPMAQLMPYLLHAQKIYSSTAVYIYYTR
ncbi:DUF2206 domain-containing protein [Thermococcus sp. 21S9]|nr:DUF2206 domain-containing protein [Thermococcus sp. 21S9]